MKKYLLLFRVILLLLAFHIVSEFSIATLATTLSTPNIVRLDSRANAIVPADAVLEKIADGFSWLEGPVWNRAERFLLFSNVPDNEVLKWKQGEAVSVFLKPSGYTGKETFEGKEPGSNGLSFDSQGRLVFCQHGDRKISRLEKTGSSTTVVDHYNGKRLNSPNDVIFKSNGDMYFTDPPFGLPKSFDDPNKELEFQGVYKYSKNGILTLLTGELKGPNGIAFSPDEKQLYVSDYTGAAWFVFDVRQDGSVFNKRLLLDANGQKKNGPGGPDGMKVDQRGNIFAAGPGGLYIIAPGGRILGRFDFGVPIGNCAWGEDGSTLFIAANTALYRIRLTTRGAGF
ncbi:SMP-30/gluconolactonase/LRE family protein [bacterium]|nr:SMP-30/gluconolactonase/LRE family protein [bacterium]